jgi:hypothetical protein
MEDVKHGVAVPVNWVTNMWMVSMGRGILQAGILRKLCRCNHLHWLSHLLPTQTCHNKVFPSFIP